MTIDMNALSAPFAAAEVEWRVGSTNQNKTSGLALAYLTARHVMDRLDEVCGPANWQDRYEFHGARTVCYLSIRIDGEWVTKADGAGDSDVEAEKGAISDALKRAAVKWGIGRYLYDLGNIWVDVEAAGRSVKIKANQYTKLQNALTKQFGGAVAAREPVQDEAPKEQAQQPSGISADELSAFTNTIKTASDMTALKGAFGAAWSAVTDADQRATLKATYDQRKAALEANSTPFDGQEAA